jgi:hypothetical protein
MTNLQVIDFALIKRESRRLHQSYGSTMLLVTLIGVFLSIAGPRSEAEADKKADCRLPPHYDQLSSETHDLLIFCLSKPAQQMHSRYTLSIYKKTWVTYCKGWVRPLIAKGIKGRFQLVGEIGVYHLRLQSTSRVAMWTHSHSKRLCKKHHVLEKHRVAGFQRQIELKNVKVILLEVPRARKGTFSAELEYIYRKKYQLAPHRSE